MRHGKVRWFDSSSGVGFIRDNETQVSYKVHYSAIEGSRQGEWLNLTKDMPVVYELIEDYNWSQVSKVYAGPAIESEGAVGPYKKEKVS